MFTVCNKPRRGHTASTTPLVQHDAGPLFCGEAFCWQGTEAHLRVDEKINGAKCVAILVKICWNLQKEWGLMQRFTFLKLSRS